MTTRQPRPSNYDRLQDQWDESQHQDIRNLENRLTGVETDVVEQPDQVSTLQRFRIYVPAPNTHFLLGQRLTGNSPFGYTGASLHAQDNLFVDVGKDTVFQTEGFTLMQSYKRWQQYSKDVMELSTPASLKMVGGRVFIGSLENPMAPSFNPLSDGDGVLEPNTPNPLEALAITRTKSVMNWDRVVTSLGLVHSAVFFTAPDKLLSEATIPAAEGIGGMIKDVVGMFDDPSTQDVNIYGHGGVNVHSPGKILVSTEDEFKTFAAKDTGITSGLYSTLQAGIGAKCFGGFKASVEAGVYAEMKAASTVGVASLRATVEVKGKKLELGAHVPNIAQVATKAIELKATEDIELHSKQTIHLKSDENTHVDTKQDVQVDSKKNVKVKAKEMVQIQVGAYCIEVKTDGIKIGKGSNGTPKDPLITIKGKDIILESSSMSVKVANKSTHMGSRGTYVNVLDSGSIFVKGKVIKLG